MTCEICKICFFREFSGLAVCTVTMGSSQLDELMCSDVEYNIKTLLRGYTLNTI